MAWSWPSTDRSTIHHNEAGIGGGVYNVGTLTLHDSSSIHDNEASSNGGGVYDMDHGTLVNGSCGLGGNVHDNTPHDCYP